MKNSTVILRGRENTVLSGNMNGARRTMSTKETILKAMSVSENSWAKIERCSPWARRTYIAEY